MTRGEECVEPNVRLPHAVCKLSVDSALLSHRKTQIIRFPKFIRINFAYEPMIRRISKGR